MVHYPSWLPILCLVVSLVTAGCSTHTVTSAEPTPSASAPSSTQIPQQAAKISTPLSTSSPSDAASKDQDSAFLNKIRKDLSEKVALAKQDTGKTYLSTLILSQQAEKLVQGKFTTDLKRLSLDIPTDTEEYRLEIRQADASQAIMVAIAKQSGFASYTGAVYAVEGNIPTTGICKTNLPSKVPPPAPKLVQSVVMCPAESSAVN